MSVQAISWVLDYSPAKGSDRLVLISIANHAGKADDEDVFEAYPGIDTIQREAGLDRRRTVNDALTRLIETGAVERVVNGAPDNRIPAHRRPNLYRIITGGVTADGTPPRLDGVTRNAERGDALRPDGVTNSDRMGCRGSSPKPLEEPSGEPSLEPGHLFDAPPIAAAEDHGGFDVFYAVYPRKVAPGKARTAYAAARKRAGHDEIMTGLTRYVAETKGTAPKFIAHPASWLNGDRWADEPGANAAAPTRGAAAPVPRRNFQPGKVQL